MATARKAPVDPLIEELPPATKEYRPNTANDVKFDVEVSPYIVNGAVFYRWDIRNHTHVEHIGSYVGHGSPSHETSADAEKDAQEYVDRIRHTIALKLDLPEPYSITL